MTTLTYNQGLTFNPCVFPPGTGARFKNGFRALRLRYPRPELGSKAGQVLFKTYDLDLVYTQVSLFYLVSALRGRNRLSGMGRQLHSKIESFFDLPLLGNRFAFFTKAIEMKPKHLFEMIQRRGQILTVVGDS